MRLPLAAVGVALLASCAACAAGASGRVDAQATAPTSGVPRTSVPAASALEACPASTQVPALASGGLPDVTLACLDPSGGVGRVRLAGLRGTPTVLSVWASWCEPCRTELPAVAEVEHAAGASVRFLGIDVEDTAGDARDLAAALGVRFNSVQDPDGSTKQSLGWIGPPVTLYVDAAGRVVGRTIGTVGDASHLRTLIQQNLGVTVG